MKIPQALRLAFVVVVGALLTHSPQQVQAARNVTAVVDVIAYNDVYEMLQDNVNGLNIGGPSRVVPIVKQMRAKNPNSLMVDAHNAIGVDYASLGSHEFDFGVDTFLNVSTASSFPWLNVNCFELTTGALLRGTTPRAIKVFNDPVFGKVKIGIFGVMYDMKDASKGLYWGDPIKTGKRQVTLLKAQGMDFIIAMTHQNLADDNRLSKAVAGVNIIYAGHDHTSMLQTNFGASYLKADFDFRSTWSSHLEYFAPSGTLAAYTRMTHTVIPIVEELPTDPVVEAIITDYANKTGPLHACVIDTLCESLDLSNKLVRAYDALVGYIFSDASLAFCGPGGADIAATNGGGIRTDTVCPAGPLTIGQVIAWSPFGNTLMVIETDGASLKEYIQREIAGSCSANQELPLNGFYVHPSGFKYAFKYTGQAVGDVASIEWFKHPTRTARVLDTDIVKVALSNYLYTSEFFFTPGAVVRNVLVRKVEASRVGTALEVYIKSLPDASVCVKAEGRSIISF